MDTLRAYFHTIFPQATETEIEDHAFALFTDKDLYLEFLLTKLAEDSYLCLL